MKLHANQQRVHNSEARFVVLMAGGEFCKTPLAGYKCLKAAAKKNQNIWYVAPTYSQAEDIAWREFLQYMPNRLIKRVNINKLSIEWINGSVIQLKGADKEGRLRGPKVHYMVLDEAQDLKPFMWEQELRPNLLYTRGGAMFIGTPSGRNWFWRLWSDAKKRKEWAAYQFRSWDNPMISSEERERVESETPDTVLRQEYEAEADCQSGVVYSEFNNFDHIIEPRGAEPGRPVYISIDWGLHDPTCALWAYEDKDGSLIFFQEHYQAGWNIDRQASRIKELSQGLNIDWTVIDPHTNKRDPNNFKSIRSCFLENGISCVPGDDRIAYGITIIKKYLQQNKLKICSNLRNLIREIGNLEWKNTGISTSEEHVRINDHATDALKYMVTRHYAINPLEEVPKPAMPSHLSNVAFVPKFGISESSLPEDLEAVFHGQF